MKQSNTISLSKFVKRYGVAFFILLSTITVAQTRGTVTVIKDAGIDSVLTRRLTLSKQGNSTNSTSVTANGYRVQFFVSSNRNEAYNAQAKFNDMYPGYKTYIIYSEPNFKVRAGDFRTRLEATRLMQQLRGQFTSLFIIGEKINLPKTGNDD